VNRLFVRSCSNINLSRLLPEVRQNWGKTLGQEFKLNLLYDAVKENAQI